MSLKGLTSKLLVVVFLSIALHRAAPALDDAIQFVLETEAQLGLKSEFVIYNSN